MSWELTYSPDLLEKKKIQLQKRLSQNEKDKPQFKLKNEQIPFDDQNEGKNQLPNNNFYREKFQEKDKFRELTLAELLKLQYLGDYDRQIKNIVQMVHLHPIKLKIPQEIEKFLYLSVLSEMNEPAKEINLKISTNYEIIAYKSRLFLASKIMIRQGPASNFDDNRFDIYVYCETGEMICSFHNFDTMEKLIKYLRRKFRRVQTIYFLQIFDNKKVSLDQYMEAKMLLQVQNYKINLRGIFCTTNLESISFEQPFVNSLNGKEIHKQQFKKFCLQNSIELVQKDTIKPFQVLNGSQFLKYTRAVLKKIQFDRSFFKMVSYGDEKIIQYRKRNQISLKLMNYCFSRLYSNPNENQSLSPSKVQQFFTQIVHQIAQQRQKFQLKQIQRIRQQPPNHQIELLQTNPRQCLKCKHKTKYRCKKCSLKYQIEAMICKNCFEDFHSDQYFKTEALPTLTRKIRKQNESGKYRSKIYRMIDRRSCRNRIRQKAHQLDVLKSVETQKEKNKQEMDGMNEQKDEGISDPLKEYRKMCRYIYECQKGIKYT